MKVKKVKPSIITIFGGSGDLTKRKLIPALYNLYLAGWLDEKLKIICNGRREIKNEDFIESLRLALGEFSRTGEADPKDWEKFSKSIEYFVGDFTEDNYFDELKLKVDQFEKEANGPANKIYYLAVNPQFFSTISLQLANAGLGDDKEHSRVVIEKPFGTDLKTAEELNAELLARFDECQLYRIDHYLGKETVQNILALRFANVLFEPLWNRTYIDNIQITVAEDIGVEDRGGYYNNSGALRDMIQNHVMQLICLIAMEPPVNFDANEIRNKKVDVLQAVRPITEAEVNEFAVRGQYGEGLVNGEKVSKYLDEKGIPAGSSTETFVAMKMYIDNWRWKDIPFYIRTGKRMSEKFSAITVEFKPVPHQSFPKVALQNWEPNRMIINIQPDMGVRMTFQAKTPGLEMILNPVDMLFNYKEAYPSGLPEGYETLLLDVLQGEATLFMRADQVEAAWKIVMPILNHWHENGNTNFPNYESGTNGPKGADDLLAKEGHTWIVRPFDEDEK